tara:strand:+ start:2945 stop:3862 length:918 start_codon:yes stop_codon:yes gene_type:complete
MKILIGQNHLDTLGGSETFTYALVEELHRRGHEVGVMCARNRKGMVSDLIESNLGIRTNIISKEYDACFISHNSMISQLYSLGINHGTVYQICHGTTPSLEQPTDVKGVRFISISEEVQEHLLKKDYNSELIVNGIDLDRFKPTKINKELQNILSLSQSDRLNKFLQKICDRYGYNFKHHNKFLNPVFNIEEEIADADLVVSLGRGAYEAMACGKNVLIADWRAYQNAMMDGMVTEDNISRFISNNCSGRTERRGIDEASIVEELMKYSLANGEANRKFAEKNLNIKDKVDRMIHLVEGEQNETN